MTTGKVAPVTALEFERIIALESETLELMRPAPTEPNVNAYSSLRCSGSCASSGATFSEPVAETEPTADLTAAIMDGLPRGHPRRGWAMVKSPDWLERHRARFAR